MENKVKHLEMIEKIIERMAKNCFQLKGWAMTLVALVGALGAKEGSEPKYMLLAFIPILAFWPLDAFYVQQERRYKALYREVTEIEESKIDFNLNTRLVKYTDDEAKRICFCKCMFSVSELLFYIPLTAALIVLAIILKVF